MAWATSEGDGSQTSIARGSCLLNFVHTASSTINRPTTFRPNDRVTEDVRILHEAGIEARDGLEVGPTSGI